jgi:dolichyl-phosphate beta-glucosyltransferase
MVSISVVIPAYNEEKRLGRTMKTVLDYLKEKNHDYELIIVDDGSKDHTVDVAKEFGDARTRVIRNDRNHGKGYTVRNGMLNASKEWILFADADLSTPIDDLELLLENDDAQVVIGSRGVDQSKVIVHQPFYREFSGKIFNRLVRLLTVRGVKDTQCGMKMFRRDAAHRIFSKQTIEGFGFDVEILFIAQKYGYKIVEVPVRWFNDTNTKVRFLRDATRMFMDLLRIRKNDLLGRYKETASDQNAQTSKPL